MRVVKSGTFVTHWLCLLLATLAAIVVPASEALAQVSNGGFVGGYAGASVGAVDHHFVLEETTQQGGLTTTSRFNVTRWGIGGEVFGGYDLPLYRRFVIGAEVQAGLGGRTATENSPQYTYGFKPKFGASISGRLGYVVSSGLMTYAGAGFGDQEYRTIVRGNAGPGLQHSLDHARSFILRAGVEAAVINRVHVRLEFEHLDGTRNQFMVGVPIRF